MAKPASKIALLIVVAVASALGGYGWRDHQLVARSHTLADVLVVERHDEDNSFVLQTAKGQAFNAKFCSDSPIDWQRGEKMKVINYEQRTGCKSIAGKNLGFLAYTDSRGNRIKFEP